MKQLTVTRSESERVVGTTSYRMDLEITAAENITSKVFVKQRLLVAGTSTYNDVFVAVCTPAQIEDLPEDNPTDTSFFRVSKIELVNENPEYLEQVAADVLIELKQLIASLTYLETTSVVAVYTVTASDITPVI